MEKFIELKSRAVPLPINDIDTDQIIPARFLKSVSNTGFGDCLFKDWRYNSNNQLNESFILNNTKYSGNILITGRNFGCGSSREHAVWAILDYGFKVVISSFFADIFKNNALNKGLLPIEISEQYLNIITNIAIDNPKTLFKVDIKKSVLSIDKYNVSIDFSIGLYKKMCFINGYDDIDFLMSIKNKITNFELNYNKKYYFYTIK